MELIKENTAVICLSPYSGGMELDSIKLAKKLSYYSDITVIAKDGYFIDSKKDTYVGYNNIKLRTINFKSNLSLSIILEVRKIILENSIKNVIFFGASELKSLYFSFFNIEINLIVRHGTTKSSQKKDWFHKLIYSNVNYHVSICNHLLNNVRYIIPFGKNTQEKLIYSSLEFENVKHIPQNKLTLLHIGRIASGKGQIDAIKACEILIKNDIDFIFNIVGGFDDGYEDYFMNFYNNCKYKDKINLMGFTSNIQEYIQKADIFLFPSYGEGLSNSFLEAISNNILCIAYNNTSFPELIDLGLYFKIIKNKDINELGNILLNVVNNLEEEIEKSNQNYNKCKELFSLEKEIYSYMEILR